MNGACISPRLAKLRDATRAADALSDSQAIDLVAYLLSSVARGKDAARRLDECQKMLDRARELRQPVDDRPVDVYTELVCRQGGRVTKTAMALQLITDRPGLSTLEIATRIEQGKNSAAGTLNQLRLRGFIERIGAGWYLVRR